MINGHLSGIVGTQHHSSLDHTSIVPLPGWSNPWWAIWYVRYTVTLRHHSSPFLLQLSSQLRCITQNQVNMVAQYWTSSWWTWALNQTQGWERNSPIRGMFAKYSSMLSSGPASSSLGIPSRSIVASAGEWSPEVPPSEPLWIRLLPAQACPGALLHPPGWASRQARKPRWPQCLHRQSWELCKGTSWGDAWFSLSGG